MGILAAIAIPRMSTFRQTAQLSANNATAAVIGKATEAYLATLSQTDYEAALAAGTVATTVVKDFVDDTNIDWDDVTITVNSTDGSVTVEGPGVDSVQGKYPAPSDEE